MKTLPKKAFIVIGSGFGDEGKGLATDMLCLQHPAPLVIRFNGGQQAGHTVATLDGKRHVFSNFGSGTLRGVPTYWSAYCTFSPGSMLKEYAALRKLGVQPELLVDNLCAVATHYDVLYNRVLETARGNSRHGSCGMGFGATIERHQLSPVKLFAQDLLFPEFCKIKLKTIREHYRQKLQSQPSFDFDALEHDAADDHFIQTVTDLLRLQKQHAVRFVTTAEVFTENTPWQTFVFEGAQGLLLDMDFGFFPHVTRSNTCSKNALALVDQYLKPQLSDLELFYITRAYQTRHGQGPMTHEEISLSLINNENETNQYNEHQGVFRVSPLDIDLLNYALQCDTNYSYGLKKNLLMTCVDQLPGYQVPYFKGNQLQGANYEEIPSLLNQSFGKTLFSFSDCAENIHAPVSVSF
ncbi:adenylosuccinate synthetase [Cytophagaceae bacterium DM2B3-1]|uniref:Adenylosuccinate synthetase n=1 Tax=Xanthocytophaga flava TaxID=3048013 RepID=A0ABT7CHN0_9BACT|nr:adenylosuccinate synthetase [Xanthocytophaga flavus]MDJ1492562.1 adenylosuccinate synthetase [Xanthocytophaga flavus]